MSKCEFESVIKDDDLELLLRLMWKRQVQRTHDPVMKTIWQYLQKEIQKRFSQ